MWFLVFLIFSSVPLISQQPILPGSTKIDTSRELPPNPIDLKPSWWSYFEVDHEQFKVRVQKTQELFEEIKLDLSSEQKQSVSSLTNQIIVGLWSYWNLSKQKLEISPSQIKEQESYSLEDFFQLGKYLNEIKVLNDYKMHQMRIEKHNLRSDESYLDLLMASYPTLSKSSFLRLVKGLKIMAMKVSIEIDQLKLTALQTQINRDRQKIQEVENEVDHARMHIQFADIQLGPLKQKVKEAHIMSTQAQEALLEVQSHFADKQTLIASEQILYQSLERAVAEVNFIEAQLKYIFAQIAQQSKKPVSDLYSQLNEIEENQSLIDREMDDWESAAQHFLELALNRSDSQAVSIVHKTLILVQNIRKQERFNLYLIDQTRIFIRTHYASFSDRILEFWQGFSLIFKRYIQWSHKSLFKIGQAPITFYGILKLVITIIIFYFLAKFVQLAVNRMGRRQRRFGQSGIYALGRLLYYSIFIIGIIISVSGIGLDLTAFAVIAGALSVGIGFGLQSIVNNFVSGIIILLEKKLRIGDCVQLESGEIGYIMEINVRTTLVRTFDCLEVLVPNSDFVSKKFINWTLSDKMRRVRIPFGVAFETDKDKVKQVIEQAALKVPITVKEIKPQVWLSKIGESSLDFELVVWVNESLVDSTPMGTLAWYTWEVESALRENEIKIPYPVRDVNLSTL